ncbi:MAG: hypothetical protein ACXWZ4_17680 [Gemmatirosa sp.]
MRFHPVEPDGRRVRQVVHQPFQFRLDDGPPTRPTRLVPPRP